MRRLSIIAAALVVLVLVVEGVARFVLGLGTPPLTVAHPRIEYHYAPDQAVTRFGNLIEYNELGIRAAPISDWGAQARVLVLGDSVVNGGALTDQARLATEIVSTDSDARFINISAGSWGPDNLLGWIETHGLLDAAAAILVLSSHDADDAPEFAGLSTASHPTSAPFSATTEALTRYVPRYIPALASLTTSRSAPVDTDHVGRTGVDALPLIFDTLAKARTPACVVLHATRSQRATGQFDEFAPLRDVIARAEVPVLTLGDWSDASPQIYRDNIHLNDTGQADLALALAGCRDAAKVPAMVAPT